ncbi:MAG: hypothetical protein AAF708_21795, partial [Deinococcota bacterium]
TASVFEEGRNEVLASGCDEFLHKPFSRDALLDVVIRYFKQDQQQGQAPSPSTPTSPTLAETVMTPAATPTQVDLAQPSSARADDTRTSSADTISSDTINDIAALPLAWRLVLLELLSVGDISGAHEHLQSLTEQVEHQSAVTYLGDMLSAFQLDDLLELLETVNTASSS